jgi:hypothetical protein
VSRYCREFAESKAILIVFKFLHLNKNVFFYWGQTVFEEYRTNIEDIDVLGKAGC